MTSENISTASVADLEADVAALELLLGQLLQAHMEPAHAAKFLRGLRKQVLAEAGEAKPVDDTVAIAEDAEDTADAAAGSDVAALDAVTQRLIVRIDELTSLADKTAHDQQKAFKAEQMAARLEQARKAAKKKREKEKRWGKK